MTTEPERLEAVFYSAPVPLNLATLTLCALIFDRLHFPNVRIPFEGFDPEWVRDEVQRIEGTGLRRLAIGGLPVPPRISPDRDCTT